MIIPWGTDAPIYHRPVATVALIGVNILAFLRFPVRDHEEWALSLGDGIHPLQWVTSNFMHMGFMHLLGNMIFLWAFGIIVEGKLGWWAFTLVYLLLGLGEGAVLQFLVHPAEPAVMAGASGVVYGLLAMCLVWAPRNDLQVIVLVRFWPMDFELPILWVAGLYIGLEVLEAAVRGFAVSSALGHVTGAVCGFVLAIAMLKLKLVDCENWDIFAVMAGRQGEKKTRSRKPRYVPRSGSGELAGSTKPKGRRKPKGATKAVKSIEDARAEALRTLRLHLELGENEAALAVYRQSKSKLTGWQPPDRDWVDLIQAVLKEDAWNDAAVLMRDYVQHAQEPSPRVRLKLAQILIQKLGRPLQGRRVLDQIPAGALPESLETTRRQLLIQADQMGEDGELELQDEMW
jgi:membrane associated rhomboid family serine protease